MIRYASAALAAVGLSALWLTPGAAQGQKDAWGTIKGQLVYGGPVVPQQKPLKINKDESHCLAKGPILDPEWIVNKENKGVKNVFVWLAPDPNGPTKTLPIHPSLQAVPKEPHVIDQPQCMFEPYASVMREGQEVIVKNSAPVNHNIRWTGDPEVNPGGNVTLPPSKEYLIKDLKAQTLPLLLQCNIHPWMSGRLAVYDHPYFAVTDKDGNFEIKLAPAGNFRVFIWHDGAGWRLAEKGSQGEPIAVKAGQTTDLGKLPIQEVK